MEQRPRSKRRHHDDFARAAFDIPCASRDETTTSVFRTAENINQGIMATPFSIGHTA
jgi:hypothetical protein